MKGKIMNTKKTIKSSIAKRNIQKFYTNRLALFGLIVVAILIIMSLIAPFITPHDPNYVDSYKRLQAPSSEHWLGTDNAGRDLFARLVYGGRVSILVGIASALGASIIGVILGCIAGYFGGKVDAIILYFCETFVSFPSTILVLVMVGLVGRGLSNLIIIFCVTGWMGVARIVRSKIMSLREEPFVESCIANGISGISIMFRHLLPNTLGPVIVSITLATADFVLEESALSFLGIGVPPNVATWGNIINSAKSLDIFQNHPMLWVVPGLMISLFALSVNFFGDGLRDVLDVRQ
ncbi:MAG: ABC transporter permease [Clostridiales bacterium]|nr:ABC transporter permease [Clostridiales bacterium]